MEQNISRTYYDDLKTKFQNNLYVISELQQENKAIRDQNQALEQESRIIKQQNALLAQENIHLREEYNKIDETNNQMRKHFSIICQNKENQITELKQQIQKIEKKYSNTTAENSKKNAQNKKQLQQIAQMTRQKAKHQLQTSQRRRREQKSIINKELQLIKQSLNHSEDQKKKLFLQIRQLKQQLLQFEQINEQLNQKNKANAKKFDLHQEQLQSIRRSSSQWQGILQFKIKQLHKEKLQLQQSHNQYKLHTKEALRKAKEDYNKKTIQLQQDKERSLRNLLNEASQIKHKYDTIIKQNDSLTKDVTYSKQQYSRLQKQLQTATQSKKDNSSQQHQYMQQLYEQQREHHRQQLQLVTNEKKEIKQELESVREKLSGAQKALERVKTQLLNQCRINDEMKRGRKDEVLDGSKDVSNMFNSGIDSHLGMHGRNNQFTQHYDAKRNAQIQLENQQLKGVIRLIKEQMESTRRIVEQTRRIAQEDKQVKMQQIQMHINQCHALKERLYEDKKNNLQLKQNYQQLQKSFDNLKKTSLEQINQLTESKDSKIKLLQQQLKNAVKQRDLSENISAQLKAEVNDLNEQLSEKNRQIAKLIEELNELKNIQYEGGFNTINQPSFEQSYSGPTKININKRFLRQNKEEQQSINNVQNILQTGKKSPAKLKKISPLPRKSNKLHDLIKERKLFSVAGKKVVLQERKSKQKRDKSEEPINDI